MYVISLIISFIAVSSAGKHDAYKGYTVHGVKLRAQTDNAIIQELEQQFEADVWDHGYPGVRDASVMLAPGNREEALRRLDEIGIEHYEELADVAEALETHDEQVQSWKQTQSRNGRLIPFNDYPRYNEVTEYLQSIAARYPDVATLEVGGQSFEGRDIVYLKISTSNFTDTSKPIFFMEAMLHAREWVTTPVTLFSIHRLVENLRSEDRDLLETIDWIIMPVVNPDGYEFSHTDMRMWRRTRSFRPENAETCYGVDGNRNFDAYWNTTGVSSNPCSDIYMGPEAFSEPETRVVRDVLLEHIDRTQIFVDIHSHGNWVLFPYGFNGSVPSNGVELFHVASAMGAAMDALKLPQAGFYVVGNSALALYPTSGASDDYAQLVGVPLSFCLELPGYGYNFLVPPEYIEQINFETWEGIAVAARLARSYYRARR